MLTSGTPIERTHREITVEAALKVLVESGSLKAPAFPKIALEVSRILRNPKSSAADLARIIASDEVLAVKVLQRANGPNVASRGLTSLPLAVARVGRREIAEIVYAESLGEMAKKAGPLAGLRQRVWLEAVVSAVLCKRLAAVRNVDRDEGFVAGLVHDLGRVLTIGALEEVLSERASVASRTEDEWLELVDRHHLEVGDRAASEWRLPEALAEVLRCHHHPRRSAMANRPIVTLVALADQIGACCWAFPHIAKEQLAKQVRMPLKGFESSIAQAIPGTGSEAAALANLAAETKSSSSNPIVEITSIVAAERIESRGALVLEDGSSFEVLSIARDGLVAHAGSFVGFRMAEAQLNVDGETAMRATGFVRQIGDNLECRWFTLSPPQKRDWDVRFRAARAA